jgi:hypothetical protein
VAIHVRHDAAKSHEPAADEGAAIVPSGELLGGSVTEEAAGYAMFDTQEPQQQYHGEVLLFLVGLEIMTA